MRILLDTPMFIGAVASPESSQSPLLLRWNHKEVIAEVSAASLSEIAANHVAEKVELIHR
jgi:PIN domain nuclease of toxin-antitoxin system